MAQADAEEATLLMARTSTIHISSPPLLTRVKVATKSVTTQPVVVLAKELVVQAAPGVSAIKPYEGFGDVDHTIKELISF
jgi:hypothetical protein